MTRLTRESNVLVGSKKLTVDEILHAIIYLPAHQVKAFFVQIGLTIPREIRIHVLRELLRDRVAETQKTRLTMADELNYRLSWFPKFTETQLENLLTFYDDRELDKQFLQSFWTILIGYMLERKVSPKDLKRLYDAATANIKVEGFKLPDVKTYNREIKDLFYDTMGRIDGLSTEDIRPVLYKSSTISEIRDFGAKYNVDVPRRLKKNELADIIINELKERNQYTEELENEIRSKSVILLQRFAIDNDIKASTELKKEEVIEFVLKNAKETKEAYFIPATNVYEKEVGQVTNGLLVPEEIIEEKVEESTEVVETPIVTDEIETIKTPIVVQTVEHSLELSALIEEIRRLRIALEKHEVKPVFLDEQIKMEPKEEKETSTEDAPAKEKVEEVTSEVAEKPASDMFIGKKKEYRRYRMTPEDNEEEFENEVIHTADIAKEVVTESDDAKAVIEPIDESIENFDDQVFILNSTNFNGNKKDYKKYTKEEIQAEKLATRQEKKELEVSKFVDDQVSKPKEKQPIELRLLLKLLKIALIVLLIAVVLFIIYGLLTKFVTITFLDGVNDWINTNLPKINGKGMLEWFHDLLTSLGL